MSKGQTYKINSLYKGAIVLGVYKHYTRDIFFTKGSRFKTSSWILVLDNVLVTETLTGSILLESVWDTYKAGSNPFQIVEFLPAEELEILQLSGDSKVTWLPIKEHQGESVGFIQTDNLILEIDNELKEWEQEDL